VHVLLNLLGLVADDLRRRAGDCLLAHEAGLHHVLLLDGPAYRKRFCDQSKAYCVKSRFMLQPSNTVSDTADVGTTVAVGLCGWLAALVQRLFRSPDQLQEQMQGTSSQEWRTAATVVANAPVLQLVALLLEQNLVILSLGEGLAVDDLHMQEVGVKDQMWCSHKGLFGNWGCQL